MPWRNGAVLQRDFDRGLNLEFDGSRTELEGITMDFKKFVSAGKPDTRAAKLKGTRPATIRATTRAFK